MQALTVSAELSPLPIRGGCSLLEKKWATLSKGGSKPSAADVSHISPCCGCPLEGHPLLIDSKTAQNRTAESAILPRFGGNSGEIQGIFAVGARHASPNGIGGT
jgi:hypothetical protein